MIIFYDTETTGKAKNFKLGPSAGDNWPRIVQLGYAVFSNDGDFILSANNIIRPDGWTIDPEAEAIHGISMEKAQQQGIPIKEALIPFFQLHKQSLVCVCHNVAFDINVVESERLRMGSHYEVTNKPHYCTMTKTTELLKLPGKYGKHKWPSLKELHWFLFEKEFEKAHDALGDVTATANCFFELITIGFLKVKDFAN